MRALCLALLLTGCVSEHAIAIELRPPRGPDGGPEVPADVVAHEVRLYRLGPGDACPGLIPLATAAPFAELVHAQAFPAGEGMGDAVGEVPSGSYALVGLSRDADCGVRLFGCRELEVGLASFETFVVEIDPVVDAPDCGACRSCTAGVCAPIDATCR